MITLLYVVSGLMAIASIGFTIGTILLFRSATKELATQKELAIVNDTLTIALSQSNETNWYRTLTGLYSTGRVATGTAIIPATGSMTATGYITGIGFGYPLVQAAMQPNQAFEQQ